MNWFDLILWQIIRRSLEYSRGLTHTCKSESIWLICVHRYEINLLKSILSLSLDCQLIQTLQPAGNKRINWIKLSEYFPFRMNKLQLHWKFWLYPKIVHTIVDLTLQNWLRKTVISRYIWSSIFVMQIFRTFYIFGIFTHI